MIIDTVYILIILLLFNMTFWLGWILGKNMNSQSLSESQPISFIDKQKTVKNYKNNISIDETKYVTKINTDGLEKKYDNLGAVVNSNEQISSSVNKLKNLKDK